MQCCLDQWWQRGPDRVIGQVFAQAADHPGMLHAQLPVGDGPRQLRQRGQVTGQVHITARGCRRAGQHLPHPAAARPSMISVADAAAVQHGEAGQPRSVQPVDLQGDLEKFFLEDRAGQRRHLDREQLIDRAREIAHAQKLATTHDRIPATIKRCGKAARCGNC